MFQKCVYVQYGGPEATLHCTHIALVLSFHGQAMADLTLALGRHLYLFSDQ